MSITDWKDKIIKGSQFTTFHYDLSSSTPGGTYPFAMICFPIGDDITIAVGVDPVSPEIYLKQNRNSSFELDLSITPKSMMMKDGQKTVYYAKKVKSNTEILDINIDLDFVFSSSDHMRYEDGKHVSGPHGGAPRAIKVENNITGGKGYTVSIYNTNNNKVKMQMDPKQMGVTEISQEKIVLRGFGEDMLGQPFDDYGMTFLLKDGYIESCTLHMYDRGVDITYLS